MSETKEKDDVDNLFCCLFLFIILLFSWGVTFEIIISADFITFYEGSSVFVKNITMYVLFVFQYGLTLFGIVIYVALDVVYDKVFSKDKPDAEKTN